MNKEVQKNWTILVYANGNNDLEPEMWQAKLDAERIGSDQNVNVVMQIGREDRQLAKVMRPTDSIADAEDKWTGVRRYYIKKNQSVLLDYLGNTNMAHPNMLYDFAKWGIENYPAKHYMLILGGHAFQLIGMMTDYSQSVPYIMGIPEMAKALNLIKKDTGKKIDILVLDTCYMNSVEVIYELGQEENHVVQNLLTYIGGGPIVGLPYDRLICLVQENNHNDLSFMMKKIIHSLNIDLVAFEINHNKLEQIKSIFDKLAFYILQHEIEIDTNELLFNSNPKDPWYGYVSDLHNSLSSIIVHYKNVSETKANLIKIAIVKPEDTFILFYLKLGFVGNNSWTQLLLDKSLNVNNAYFFRIKLEPTTLPLDVIYSYISLMNPALNKEQNERILKELLYYKKWNQS